MPDTTRCNGPFAFRIDAFNSHLTRWRTPETALYPASFVTLNFTWVHGMPWTGWPGDAPVRDLPVLFNEFVSPPVYQDLSMTGQLVVGEAELTGLIVRKAPSGIDPNPAIRRLYDRFLGSLADLNRCTMDSRSRCVCQGGRRMTSSSGRY